MNFQNWDKEIRKWLGGRVNALPMDSGGKDETNRNLGLSDTLRVSFNVHLLRLSSFILANIIEDERNLILFVLLTIIMIKLLNNVSFHDILEKFVSQMGMRCPTPVLIISYETFRLHASILLQKEIGLIICDEV